ncbi:Uncharacterised protein [Streptococcus pneumoniae]|nr:Uncharacterised protein [Streptococcus pneumoniae]
MVLGEDPGDVGEQRLAVQRLDLDLHQVDGVPRRRPADRGAALRLLREQGRQVGTVDPVHGDPGAAGDEPVDGVRRHRVAAPCQLGHDAAVAVHEHAGVVGGPRGGAPRLGRDQLLQVHLADGQLALRLGLRRRRRSEALRDAFLHGLGGHVAVAEGHEQPVEVRVAEIRGHLHQLLAAEHLLHGHAGLAQLTGQRLASPVGLLVAALRGEVVTDLGPGPRRDHEAQPIPARPRVLGARGEDLHGVAVAERRGQRDELVVDPGADGAVADVGVDGVGEVHGRGAGRQGADLPLRREDVHLVRPDLGAQRGEELVRVPGVRLPVHHRAQPGRRGLHRRLAGDLGLVPPVRGDAVLGLAVHLLRADLDLHRLAARHHHRGVQGAVHVELRDRDVVLEPARDRVPARVDDAEHGVAVTHGVHEHPDAREVVDVVEVLPARHHLLVDRVVVLRPSGDGRPDPVLAQVLLDHGAQRRDVLLPLRVALPHEAHDLRVHLGLEGGEGEVLELPLDGVHAEPVGQRGVDVQGLLGLAGAGLRGDVPPRPRVVQPVGELDEQDVHVLGHRDDHLAHGLGLRRGAVGHLVQLGHAVHEEGDLGAEVGAEALQGVVRVLDGVVQQGRQERRARHADLGEDRGDRDGVGDVRVPGAPHLPLVCRAGDLEGADDLGQLGLGGSLPHGAHQRLEQGRVLGGVPAGQACDPAAGPDRGGTGRGGTGRGGSGVLLAHGPRLLTRAAPTAPAGMIGESTRARPTPPQEDHRGRSGSVRVARRRPRGRRRDR